MIYFIGESNQVESTPLPPISANAFAALPVVRDDDDEGYY
jgi:hypothetical protein